MKIKMPLLVVLDLDECLFHSKEEHDHDLGSPDFMIGDYFAYKRPGVEQFISALTKSPAFELAVWTSADSNYASIAVKNIFPDTQILKAVFCADNCVKSLPKNYWMDELYTGGNSERIYIKDLKKMSKKTGFPLERMIAIDDKPQFYERQYSNVISVPAFTGQEIKGFSFTELYRYLKELAKLDNIRPEEKRGWLNRPVQDKNFPCHSKLER